MLKRCSHDTREVEMLTETELNRDGFGLVYVYHENKLHRMANVY